NEMTTIDGLTLTYDKNGNLTAGLKDASTPVTLEYNWDNKLRHAEVGSDYIDIRYDPAGNRIYKSSETSVSSVARKYIVDVVGDLPTILLEMDPTDLSIAKSYIYANSQILAEHDGGLTDDKYFYLHDRLASVRQVINSAGSVVKMFTFDPFGQTLEDQGSFYTPWKFTGQYLDDEINFYYLRARMYSPYLSRFMSHDAAEGNFNRPLSLHKYLYCENDSINAIDPKGLWKDGIRYALREHKSGLFGNAYTYSDLLMQKISERLGIWETTWHGHSDMGYHMGDFDYTLLDHLPSTTPANVFAGTHWHFMEMHEIMPLVNTALNIGDEIIFELYMHMGQDYFSHIGRGYNELKHFTEGSVPDNPYIVGREREKVFNPFYIAADNWTKKQEELWYLLWDPAKWFRITSETGK
ncbi:MAG: RHS repeat-associated core domain-containing protein, partial [Sedimentisphaerales bacterium]|nr:RHS repeat-associated core domain-containing protein [Sedimentisphaerales bacterium]